MDRITAIEKSLTVFVCGIIGCLPLLGIVPAVYSILCWIKVRTSYREPWNPAAAYLRGGVILAVLGLIGSLIIAMAAMMKMVSHWSGDTL